MEDFSQREGRVSVVLEVLRQRQYVGHRLMQERLVVEAARRVRPATTEQTIARGIADGYLAISAIEDQPPRGEPVDVWRPNMCRIVAAQLGTQIIYGNEENVQTLICI